MRLLLDSHILLWALAKRERLSRDARVLIEGGADEVFASTISIWEVAIKWSLRRGLPTDVPLSGKDLHRAVTDAEIDLLLIEPAHAAALDDLPQIHGDPFDRLLVATARHEGMMLLTHDKRLAEYGHNVRVV